MFIKQLHIYPCMVTGKLRNRRTIVFEKEIEISAEKIWEAVASMDGLNSWFMKVSEEVVDRGRFSFENGWDGTVSILEPIRHIRYIADHPEKIEFDPNRSGYLDFIIKPSNTGFSVMLIDTINDGFDAAQRFPDDPDYSTYQPGGVGTHHSGVIAGYEAFFGSLIQYLTGSGKQIDWEETCRKYMAILDEFHGI